MKNSAGVLKPSVAVKQRMSIGVGFHGFVKGFADKRVVIAPVGHIGHDSPVIQVQNAEYVLSLKGNQPLLCHEVQKYFSEAVKAAAFREMEQHKTPDCGHGRIEKRTYYLSTEAGWYQDPVQWTGIRGFGMVCSEVERNGQICQDTRYFITSLSGLPAFANAVRKH